MKKYTVSKLNLLLAAGLICIMAGVLLTAIYASSSAIGFPVVPACVIFIGILFVYLALAFTHRTLMLYLGLVTCAVGVLYLLMTSHIIPYSFKRMWPFVVIICGIALFPAGFFRHHCIRTSFLFPAILLVVLGFVFLLFSFDIIRISFARFFSAWWPLLLIIFGSILVGIFLYQQHCSAKFPYMHDDEDTGDDDTHGDSAE